ncbi:hypothetical protein Clacol_005086 [Clathrus columnatus]|uniref:SMP-LTD domain-containing protein n=1 Tax=Clathrus columnatus TaxID=1419009 RepID=A0AAV5ADX3_9AGAM|nr:hypothetical protein Clacol_005086 [Clathrus columnatus]
MFYTILLTYILGGLTFIPLVILATTFYFYNTIEPPKPLNLKTSHTQLPPVDNIDLKPPTLKSWITVRRTFEPTASSSYISMVRTLLDSRSGHHRRADDAYFAILKGTVVYLYEDEPMTECFAAIDVTKCTINIYPSSNLLDGELFAKRNALLIKENTQESLLIPPWYMFFKSVSVMEDWYLALLAAQNPTSPPYPHASHTALIASLDALPDLIPTRWLNAILGRLFLAVKGTRAVEAWVIGRLMKKLNKIKKPSFLTSVVVRSFEAGDVAPVLSKPMLKELTPEGEASIGVDVSYEAPPGGEIRITVSAIATFSLPSAPSLSILGLGGGKNKEKETQESKPYEVSLVLAIVLRRLSGNMLVKIKRPPSNRIWYCFTTMPQMEMTVEPVVSDRQIKWGMVLSVIESKLREVIQESVVLPFMDDIPFFDTSAFETRGGLFPEAFKQPSMSAHIPITRAASTGPDTVPSSDVSDTDSVKVLGDSLLAGLSDSDAGSSLGQMESTSTTAPKRKSWFGRKDGTDDSPQPEVILTHKRGKSLDGSFPTTHDVSVVVTDEDAGSELKKDSGISQPIRRAQSHNTRVVSEPLVEPPPVSFDHHDSSSSSSGLSRSAPSPSPISLLPPSTPPPNSNASSGSLFATLKSRGAVMAEKPKEAMKKWGVNVNWGSGLRKNDKEQEKLREKVKEGDWELDTDHGELWGHKDGMSDYAGSRPTYAELRRKVEARERERAQVLTSPPITPAPEEYQQQRIARSSGTKPIDIPGVSVHEVFLPPAATPQDIDTPRKASPTNGTTTPFLSPSAPRTTTELQAHTSAAHVITPTQTPPREQERQRRISSPGTALPDSLPIAVIEQAPTIPIRAQPRAATMVIPGIHVSHRNDVMALSSAPPAPQPKPSELASPHPSPSLTTATGGSTLGSIQTVRRLFRGSTLDVKDYEDRKGSSTMLPAPTLTPPPIPPRKQSTEVDRSRQSPSPVLMKRDSPPESPASRALKSVVEQDAARQAPPPLPARKNITIVGTESTIPEGEFLVDTVASPVKAETTTKSEVALPTPDHFDLNPSSETEPTLKISIKPPLPPRRLTVPISETNNI